MLVKFSQTRIIDGITYTPGTHEVPAALRNHWYFKAIVADGTATIVESNSGDEALTAAKLGDNNAGAEDGQLTETQIKAASKENAKAAKQSGEDLTKTQEEALKAKTPAPAPETPADPTSASGTTEAEPVEEDEYEEGELYELEDGKYLGALDQDGEVGLIPLAQTTQAERDELVADGKITAEEAASLPAPQGDQHVANETAPETPAKPLTKAQKKAAEKAAKVQA